MISSLSWGWQQEVVIPQFPLHLTDSSKYADSWDSEKQTDGGDTMNADSGDKSLFGFLFA
jgi:hypothetical protein